MSCSPDKKAWITPEDERHKVKKRLNIHDWECGQVQRGSTGNFGEFILYRHVYQAVFSLGLAMWRHSLSECGQEKELSTLVEFH